MLIARSAGIKNVKTHLVLTHCLEESGNVKAKEVFVKKIIIMNKDKLKRSSWWTRKC